MITVIIVVSRYGFISPPHTFQHIICCFIHVFDLSRHDSINRDINDVLSCLTITSRQYMRYTLVAGFTKTNLK